MAQLRDKKTSEFLFEGTPLQVATLAQKIGFDEVIFDDVGGGFDPHALLDSYAQHKEAVLSSDDISDEHKQQVADADSLDRDIIKAASDAIAAARDRVDE